MTDPCAICQLQGAHGLHYRCDCDCHATGTRVRRRLMERSPIPHATPMGRNGLRPGRDRWHILDDAGRPLCGRREPWEMVDLAEYGSDEVRGGRICNPCHGQFSLKPEPHEFVIEDRGYITPCLIWPRTQDGQGYGRRHHGGGWHRPHREMYEAAHGPIPAGYVIHHLCEQKDCYRLDHLEAISRADHCRLHRPGDHRIYG